MAENEIHDQKAVIEFLMTPQSYPHRPPTVERIDTHGALIFLAGNRAYKLKRAVKLAYLDFSTLEKRHAVCEREFTLNSATAPELYRGILPVTRDRDGALHFQGEGETVDWVIEMERFGSDQLFDELAKTGRLDAPLIRKLTETIEDFHDKAPRAVQTAWPETLARVNGDVIEALGQPVFADLGMACAIKGLVETLRNLEPLLRTRREAGFVRRCHGDLHLKNIVLLNGEPRLFDALEFDEELATIDVLYDLAFLLMDLWQRGLKPQANALLNHYFSGVTANEDWGGLAALPLFMSMRAGVRAMVGLDGLAVSDGEVHKRLLEETRSYAQLVKELIAPPPPRFVAIGGLSGTGKTTVACALAAQIGPVPGMLHLRSDLERKALFGAAHTEHLPSQGYTPSVNDAVYDRLASKAEKILNAGYSVILDATFMRGDDRDRLRAVADRTGVRLEGVWLQADEAQIVARADARRGDASDADAVIVRKQIQKSVGSPAEWVVADARGTPEATTAIVANLLNIRPQS